MTNLNDDIKAGINLVHREKTDERYGPVYLFTNEKLDSIQKGIDFQNEDILTVAASGDQTLASIFYDAKDITIYDINPLAYYMSYLKIAAVKVFSYEEFISFFVKYKNGKANNEQLNPKYLKKLKNVLPDDVYLFWEIILDEIKLNDKGALFYIGNAPLAIVNRNTMYHKKYYEALQRKARKIEFPRFINSSITDFNESHGTYSLIYLSNILDWLIEASPFEFNTKELDEYIKSILENSVYKLCCDNGRVVTYYDIQNNVFNISDGIIGEKLHCDEQTLYVYKKTRKLK